MQEESQSIEEGESEETTKLLDHSVKEDLVQFPADVQNQNWRILLISDKHRFEAIFTATLICHVGKTPLENPTWWLLPILTQRNHRPYGLCWQRSLLLHHQGEIRLTQLVWVQWQHCQVIWPYLSLWWVFWRVEWDDKDAEEEEFIRLDLWSETDVQWFRQGVEDTTLTVLSTLLGTGGGC